MGSSLVGSWFSEGVARNDSLPFLAAVVGATAILVILTRRRAQKSRTRDARLNPRESRPRVRSDVNREVGNLLLDLQAAAREITGQIDTRCRLLEAVIRDADRKIARLEKLSGPSAGPSTSASRLDVTVGDDSEVNAALPDSPGDRRGDSLHERVYTHAEQGLNPVAIARKVGRPTGEVELILSLRPARQAAAKSR